MSIHSSELMAGGSPFWPTPACIRDQLVCLDTFFGHVRERGGRFVGLTQAARGISTTVDFEVRSL